VPSSSSDEVRAAIAADGPIPFDRFMAIALYGEHGFYSVAGRAGRRGDFITSPEVGPLFGTVLARAIVDVRRRLGDPADFTVVEVGAGVGTLARTMRDVAARYVAVELSAVLRDAHPEWVQSSAAMPTEPVRGVVLANELLDNLPLRLVVFDGSWREAFVTDDGRGGFAEVLSAPIDPRPAFLPASARTAEAVLSPWRAWLRTYRDHHRGGHYLGAPGTQDITAQVHLDQLPEPDVVRTQAQFLQRWGIDELVAEGRQAWSAAAAAPTLDALRMRSRIAESEALLDPAGLGSFLVFEWGADEPSAERSSTG
jgi:SAM-dependent MidA family methyltransferase